VDLAGFFRSLPHPILAQYQERYGGKSDKAAAARAGILGFSDEQAADIAQFLLDRFGDRRWVRSQLKAMPKSHHVALIALLQSRGIAGGTWLLQELTQAHGMSEVLWAEVLHSLGLDLWLFGNSRQSPPLFYVMPEPLALELRHQFRRRLDLAPARVEDGQIRLSKDTNYRHPVGFSVVSFLAYLRQHPVKVTRKDEVFKKHHEELIAFFSSLWGDSATKKVLEWHLDVVRELGLVHHRAGLLVVDDLALAEFLSMSARQRRDLYMAYFWRQEKLLIWLLDTLALMDREEWAQLLTLRTHYRRRYMGGVFHRRYVRKNYYLPPSGFYDPNPPLEVLQLAGLLESGLGPEGSYLRLSREGRIFVSGVDLEQLEANENIKFMLQPTFEILAPVGLPLKQLWKLGELAELKRVDRASTYLLTRESVRSALDQGWRRVEMIRFLAEGSQVGAPQNVKSTIRDWAGKHGEIEFHDALVVTCSKERVKVLQKVLDKLDAVYTVLAPGVIAIAREQREEVLEALRAKNLDPAPQVRKYDLADDPDRRRGHLHGMLDGDSDETLFSLDEPMFFPSKSLVMLGAPTAEGGKEAMAQRGFRSGRVGSNAVGADLSLKPAAAGAGDLLKLSPAKTMSVIKAAIRLSLDLEVLYPSTGDNDPGGLSRVTPEAVREDGGSSFFQGRHHRLGEVLKFQIKRIQGIRLAP
jgi:hypothetical protein